MWIDTKHYCCFCTKQAVIHKHCTTRCLHAALASHAQLLLQNNSYGANIYITSYDQIADSHRIDTTPSGTHHAIGHDIAHLGWLEVADHKNLHTCIRVRMSCQQTCQPDTRG